jgi:hypothetical protein
MGSATMITGMILLNLDYGGIGKDQRLIFYRGKIFNSKLERKYIPMLVLKK